MKEGFSVGSQNKKGACFRRKSKGLLVGAKIMSSSSSSYSTPCAACKFLRRKCTPTCVFAPYFPPDEPHKFINVHRIFGASNVAKLLNEVLPHQREDAVSTLAYEADFRVRDPVYGCVGAITFLQRQVQRLQKELEAANADLIRCAYNATIVSPPSRLPIGTPPSVQSMTPPVAHNIGNQGEGLFQTHPHWLPHWGDDFSRDRSGCGGGSTI
ncbi:hypothetical protein SAY86_009865 [Trapa natans]|uniref:LOB domain-containing protein n=1 Tax=Trapa natans TaxID=22666 RepID=A0AAN7KXM6_TRANT|nr:hypothetical protein SAY86_009865 [Trapa natans]